MACRSQKIFLLAGIFGLVWLGKPAKTSASTVEILTSNVEDLAAVSSGGDRALAPNDTEIGLREGLPASYEETQLPAESERSALATTQPLSPPAEIPNLESEAANSGDRTFSTKTQETELFNSNQKLE